MQGRIFAIYYCRHHDEGALVEDDLLVSGAKTCEAVSQVMCCIDTCVPSKLGLVKVSDNEATTDESTTGLIALGAKDWDPMWYANAMYDKNLEAINGNTPDVRAVRSLMRAIALA
jgi:hypothetical protein